MEKERKSKRSKQSPIISYNLTEKQYFLQSQEDTQKVVVEKVLECAEGIEIQNFFKENGKFNHDMRLKLGYLILRGRKVTRRAINDIADQIIGIFTGELKVNITHTMLSQICKSSARYITLKMPKSCKAKCQVLLRYSANIFEELKTYFDVKNVRFGYVY